MLERQVPRLAIIVLVFCAEPAFGQAGNDPSTGQWIPPSRGVAQQPSTPQSRPARSRDGTGDKGSGGARSQPARNRLEGNWVITFGDFIGADGLRRISAELGQPLNDRQKDTEMLMVSIRSDGSFDWTRTDVGVKQDFYGLTFKGDVCRQRVGLRRSFEVVFHEYRPDRSVVEIRGFRAETNIIDGWQRIRLKATMNDNGTLRYEISYHGPRAPRGSEYTLRRAKECGGAPPVKSRIAGCWAEERDGSPSVISIRPDGTFDWTGTLEARFSGLYQIAVVGERCMVFLSNPMMGYRVISATYTETTSEMTVRMELLDGSEGETGESSMRASLNPDGTLSLVATYLSEKEPNGTTRETSFTLHRTAPDTRRVESFMSFVQERSSLPARKKQ